MRLYSSKGNCTYVSLGIDCVSSVIWIEVGPGCDTSAVPGDVDDLGEVMRIEENLELVVVGVTIELSGDDVGKSIDDLSVLSTPGVLLGIIARGHMRQDMDKLLVLLSLEQSICQPFQLAA